MRYLLLILLTCSFLFSNQIETKPSIIDSLPKNMPLIKKIFWGEKGILRDSFVDPKSRIKELKIRRNMLQLHQKVALLTLGEMLYQYHIGNRMAEHNEYQYKDRHKMLGYITFSTYMTAASMSILAPPGMKYSKKKYSTNKLHRYLALIHFSGMMAQPILGYRTANASELGLDYDKMLTAHNTVGTITMTSYFLAFLVTLFK